MNRKTLNILIPMLSLIIFFVWGWIEGSYKHSWIIFMVSGMLMGVLGVLDKNKQKDEQKQNDRDDNA